MSVRNGTVSERADENCDNDLENDENDIFDLTFPTPTSEINLTVEYAEVVKKVRKVVKLFKNSPTKNDLLQTYMTKDMGKNIALLLDLITAETTLRFIISKLININKPLVRKLVDSLRKRISERRTDLTAILLYLHDPHKYEEDKSLFIYDETFNLPPKSVIRKAIKNIVERLEYTGSNAVTTTPVDDPYDDIPLSNLETQTAAAAPMSLENELKLTLTSIKNPGSTAQPPRSGSMSNLEVLIKKEINYFESGGLKGTYLQFAYNALMTIVPTSVEAERAFSAAGYLVCNIRSCLADDTINTLTFLRSYFQNNV
ncbi:unnamed protein product [Parnassius apollo]|uniref:(apollo) hypothetical protein n=1 Tax=Parnassius apollo TaxID=110799 RepID=A0A8S3Y5A6_PARAO|nr:unnamed protein product [Parnassius apollo]